MPSIGKSLPRSRAQFYLQEEDAQEQQRTRPDFLTQEHLCRAEAILIAKAVPLMALVADTATAYLEGLHSIRAVEEPVDQGESKDCQDAAHWGWSWHNSSNLDSLE